VGQKKPLENRMKITISKTGYPEVLHSFLYFFRANSGTYPHKKVKLSLCFTSAPRHEGVLGIGGIAPRILDLGTKWR
jgi:hypothetical protein